MLFNVKTETKYVRSKLISDNQKLLMNYIENEKFTGYDPYDTLNSFFLHKKIGKWPLAVATQIQKRNPLNIRFLLGIKKEINPKAFGLFLMTYSILFQKTKKQKYLKQCHYFFDWIKNNYSRGYSGKCWGYNFPWASPVKYMDAYIPSSVVTGFIVKGLYEYYQITNNKEVKDLICSACNFLDNDLEKVVTDIGLSISYTPVKVDICYNASLLAGESFAILYKITGNIKYRIMAIRIVDFVISKQYDDGHWNYSLDIKTKEERKQIDFHQGYILESLYEIKEKLGIENKKWETSIKKGLKFYIEQQFDKDGWSYWRLPRKYPIDIHNQSQGIITLIKLKKYHNSAQKFSNIIAKWTIDNMQSNTGYFYYQKFKTHTNKISYMRWNNAWMFLALTYLMDE